MKRIIGATLVVLLAFAAIGTLSPQEASARDCSDHASLSSYNAIFCYFDGLITKAQLQSILAGHGITLVPDRTFNQQQGNDLSTTPRVTYVSPPGTGPEPDPYRPRDLTPWDMIKRYAANQNPGDYCSPTFTVTLPSNIRTYGGRTYTVANINYNARYCNAVALWERTKDFYTDAERPPRPQISDYQ